MQIRKVAYMGISIAIFCILLFFHTRGLSIHDGGYVIHSAQNMLRGETIYKNFDFVYTPGAVFLALLSFKIFGVSILAERILAFIISLLTCFAIYKISDFLTKKKYLTLVPLFIYVFWGPTHINFISPVMLSMSSGLLAILFFLYATQKNSNKYVLYAGLASGATFIFKQNFGIMILLTGLSVWILNKKLRTLNSLVSYAIGSIIPLFLSVLYLIITNSLKAYIDNIWFYTIQQIIFNKVLNTPFIYGDGLPTVIVKTIFYTTPVWLSILSAFLLYKRQRKYLFIPLWIALSYVVSIRPETDFMHLVPILSLTGILLLLIIESKYVSLRLFGIGCFIFLSGLGLYTSLFLSYYRFEQALPLIENTIYEKSPRINIFVDRRWEKTIHDLNSYLDENTKPDDYFFIDTNAPLLYFITGRRNPTRFDFVFPYAYTPPYQKEIVMDLQNKHVKVILTENNYDKDDTLVMQYIRTHYFLQQPIDKYVLWKVDPKSATISQ